MANQYGIEISYELGHKINKALFEGNTAKLFSLLDEYLKKNDLEIPKENLKMRAAMDSGEDDYAFTGSLMR